MNRNLILIGSIIAIISISISMIISETSPRPQQPNCELPENSTKEQIIALIELGCSIDISPDIWDEDKAGWTTEEIVTES